MTESTGPERIPAKEFRIRVTAKSTGGYLLDFPAAKSWWMLSTPIVLVLLLSAFSLARMKEDFLFSLLVIVVIFANYLLQPSMRVDVDGNRLIWEGDWIVFKNTATFQKSEIVDVIVTDFRSRRINSSTVDGYHIRLLLYSGKKVTIARNLPDKPHALWLADLIKSSLGLLSCAEIQR